MVELGASERRIVIFLLGKQRSEEAGRVDQKPLGSTPHRASGAAFACQRRRAIKPRRSPAAPVSWVSQRSVKPAA